MSHENILLALFIGATILSIWTFRSHVRRYSLRSGRPSIRPDWAALAIGNFLALLILVTSTLSGGELYFRFVYDTTDSFGITKVTRRWLERHYIRNAQGFRDSVDYDTAAENDAVRRVTFVGDSFLAGYGVANVEDRFANRLRRERPGWAIEALAALGANTQNSIEIIRHWIEAGNALETVVLIYCLNDIQGVAPESEVHDARILAYQSASRPYVVRHSFLLDRLYFQLLAARDPALVDYFDFLDRAYSGPTWFAQAERLDSLLATVRDAGAELRVITFPFLHELGSDYSFRDAHARLDEFWRARGVPHLDLLEVYADRAPTELVVNARDAHPNERAHALAASTILPFLETTIENEAPRPGDSENSAPYFGITLWQALDEGVILSPGDASGICHYPDGAIGEGDCDYLGARDVWLHEHAGLYHLHYDAAGPRGWVSALATSPDLAEWTKRGPILDLGLPKSDDEAAAAYGVPYFDGTRWHLFYLGTANASAPPERIPAFPYNTLKASAESPFGPWRKQYDVTPLRPVAGTWYANTTSPGPILQNGDGYLQFFSGAVQIGDRVFRTLGLARTDDLDGAWTIDPQPILPPTEQIENVSLYYEETNQTWFLFTNRVHVSGRFTDAIVAYWSRDLEHWSPEQKAVVLDGRGSSWSRAVIGLPSVLAIGDRLAIVYDGVPGRGTAHVGRAIGLASLPLPLEVPDGLSRSRSGRNQVGAVEFETTLNPGSSDFEPIQIEPPRLGRPIRWELDSAADIVETHQLDSRFEEGRLEARVTAPFSDPYIVLAGDPVWASEYDQLRFRARIDGQSGGQGTVYFFYGDGFAALPFTSVPGWHTYRLNLAESAEWAARIDRLRLDFDGGKDATYEIELDWVELGTARQILTQASADTR